MYSITEKLFQCCFCLPRGNKHLVEGKMLDCNWHFDETKDQQCIPPQMSLYKSEFQYQGYLKLILRHSHSLIIKTTEAKESFDLDNH